MCSRQLLRIFLFVFVVLTANFSLAQSVYVDSIKLAIKTAKHDTTRLKSLVNLGKEIYNFKADTAIPIWEDVIIQVDKRMPTASPLEKQSYQATKALALSDIAYVLIAQSKLDEAFEVWEQSLKIRIALNDQKGIASIYNNIGFVYGNKGDYANQMDYLLKSLKIREKLGNEVDITNSLHNIGRCYLDIGEHEKAVTYFKKNLERQLKIKDTQGTAYSYLSLGSVYKKYNLSDNPCAKTMDECRKERYLKALEYYLSAAEYMYQSQIAVGMIDAYLAVGDIYNTIGDPEYEGSLDTIKAYHEDLVLGYFEEALNISQQVKNNGGIVKSLVKLGAYYLEQNQLTKASEYAEQAIVVAKKTNYPELLQQAAHLLFELYKRQNKTKEALEMYEYFIQNRDSLENKDKEKIIIKAQFQYDYEKKALADSLQLSKEKEVYALQLSNQKSQNLFLILLVLLVLGVTAFIYNRLKITKKQNKIIEQANKDLARQHVLNQKIFSTISHDFKGPILSLKYVLDSFKSDNNNSSLSQYLQTLNQELNTSTEMLSNLLNWAKTEIGLKDFENFTANVLNLCLETQEELKQKIEDKNLEIKVRIPQHAELNLPPDILRIAIRNVLSNAIKFSYPKEKIEINFDEQTSSLSVKDYGKGLDKETSQKLFKQEVDTDLGTMNEEGFGMGLYIVAELLYKYHFQIKGEGEKENGACFTIKPV